MKLFRILCLASLALAAACDPLEQPTYNGTICRFATVKADGASARISIDYTGETYKLDNFTQIEDFKNFDVHNNTRGIATIFYDLIADTYKFSLQAFDTINTVEPDKFPGEGYQDTLGTYFHFETLALDGTVVYPEMWTNGHFLNYTVVLYPAPQLPKDKYYAKLYPISVAGDTLNFDLIATVPNSDYIYDGVGAFYCQDISALRRQAKTDAHVATLLQQLDAQSKDSIYIKVSSCKDVEIMNNGIYRKLSGGSRTVRISYDF